MTNSAAGRKVDPAFVAKLPLPSHVIVWAEGRWRRGWLIGRAHEPSGWIVQVQYDDDHGREITTELAAEHVAPPDCQLP